MPRRAIFIGSFALLDGGEAAIRRINDAGWQAVVVTHAADPDDDRRSALLDAGARLDGVYHCPHPEDAGCACRKPGLAMLERARDEMGIDLANSCLVGAGQEDLETARASGMPALLVGGGQVESFTQAVEQALDAD